MTDYQKTKDSLLKRPNTSYWLKKAIEDLEKRDVLDAKKDANLLNELLNKRWQEVISTDSAETMGKLI